MGYNKKNDYGAKLDASQKKAFTLIELITAVGILTIVLLFSSALFKASIKSYRVAAANADILAKYRVIASNLDRDFTKMIKNMPVLLWFEKDAANPDQRYDTIMFFCQGDFESFQAYNKTTGVPDVSSTDYVSGNVARVFYGQGWSVDPSVGILKPPMSLKEKQRILAKRIHILSTESTDMKLANWPNAADVPDDFKDTFDHKGGNGIYRNETYEHDRLSLAEWKSVPADKLAESHIFDLVDPNENKQFRPIVDADDPNTYHKLMCQSISSFEIQWAYWDGKTSLLKWYPSFTDHHFGLITTPLPSVDRFGVFLNVPHNATAISSWYPIEKAVFDTAEFFDVNFFPKAFKFTFVIHSDSEAMKQSRKFTHIVYLDN